MKQVLGYDMHAASKAFIGDAVDFFADVVIQKKVPAPRVAHLGNQDFYVEGSPFVHTTKPPQKWEKQRTGMLVLSSMDEKRPVFLWRAQIKAKSQADALAQQQAMLQPRVDLKAEIRDRAALASIIGGDLPAPVPYEVGADYAIATDKGVIAHVVDGKVVEVKDGPQ